MKPEEADPMEEQVELENARTLGGGVFWEFYSKCTTWTQRQDYANRVKCLLYNVLVKKYNREHEEREKQ